MTKWRGMEVGFNQKRTVFFVIAKPITHDFKEYDSNGGRRVSGRLLELDSAERESLLDAWRSGKSEWSNQIAGGVQ